MCNCKKLCMLYIVRNIIEAQNSENLLYSHVFNVINYELLNILLARQFSVGMLLSIEFIIYSSEMGPSHKYSTAKHCLP